MGRPPPSQKPLDPSRLQPGLYETVVSRGLELELRDAAAYQFEADSDDLDDEEAAGFLADHVHRILDRALRSLPAHERLPHQVAMCNLIIDAIARAAPASAAVASDALLDPPRMLTAVYPTLAIPAARPARPYTPLSQDAVLVNAPREPTLASELLRELGSADRIDLLCAFVIMSGVRIMEPTLERLRDHGVPIRVITTTYMGATEPRALERLASLGADIRVSYDVRVTRLHAKAWLFERNSGFTTAYIGSSNLSYSALHDGLEWNVRLSQRRSPELIDRWRAAFESYWDDPQFESYDADRFAIAVRRITQSSDFDVAMFDIVPRLYQRQMLYALEVERERHGRWRNLVVAATGTGKTVVAALDFRRLAERWKGASLLFVAHREEILKQSLWTFRSVMKDGAFGELYVGGARPTQGRHVFASVQSLAGADISAIDPKAFDVLIVDEFHHSAAPTYRQILDHFTPRLLLGLTATPERLDGRDVTEWFDHHIAVELRLWDALEQGLLCPFQYFGVADSVDLSQLEWKRGGYDQAALSRAYTGNDVRVAKVLAALAKLIADPLGMCALGFCVSIDHAEYMAAAFNRAGIPSLAVSSRTERDARRDALRQLRDRQVNVLFAVDLFNEGVDVPQIDTVMFLRPTESVTVFLQQLGRGLRIAEGKRGLTVLDFIGQQHRRFRFDKRFRALTGASQAQIEGQVASDFPFLPPGCYISLDAVAKDIVLRNVRDAVRTGRPHLAQELRSLGDVDLATFLSRLDLEPEDVYRGSSPGWMQLRRQAGLPAPAPGPDEVRLAGGVGRLCHVDDPERQALYRRLLTASAPPVDEPADERERRLLLMLHFDLWGARDPSRRLTDSLRRLWLHPAMLQEAVELLDVVKDRVSHLTHPLEPKSTMPLHVHARYSRDEILAALGVANLESPPQHREGVLFVERHHVDVLLVTLDKSEREFSPSTMYRDYPISPRLFHWESQSTTTQRSPTGQRYVNHARSGSRVLLFARERKRTPIGAVPYLCLGFATYRSHVGERPMAITWALEHELPPDFFEKARAVA